MYEHSLEDQAAALDAPGRELFGLLPTGDAKIRLDAVLPTIAARPTPAAGSPIAPGPR